jgi:electron transfer flavoprotein beta subunit
MKLVVCVKQVPATEAKIRVNRDGTDVERGDLSYVVNPYDEFGVEEAIRIKERLGQGEVTVVSMGPEKVTEALRTCLAMGADKAVHLKDIAFEGSDSYTTALVLAEALKRIPHDMIFFGKQAVDDDNGAVGIQVAELLRLPHVAVVNKLEVDALGKKAVAHRQIEGGVEVVETPLPVVITCQKELNLPRYASLPNIMKAKQKPFETLDAKALGLNLQTIGHSGARLRLLKMASPPQKKGGRILEGDQHQAVSELVRLLREEAKVL